MPLTQEQLDGITLSMNGDRTSETPIGIQQLITRQCAARDDVLALVRIHAVEVAGQPVLSDAEATGLLQQLRTKLSDAAQQIVDMLA